MDARNLFLAAAAPKNRSRIRMQLDAHLRPPPTLVPPEPPHAPDSVAFPFPEQGNRLIAGHGSLPPSLKPSSSLKIGQELPSSYPVTRNSPKNHIFRVPLDNSQRSLRKVRTACLTVPLRALNRLDNRRNRRYWL